MPMSRPQIIFLRPLMYVAHLELYKKTNKRIRGLRYCLATPGQQVYFVIKGRIEAYVHEATEGDDSMDAPSTGGMDGPGLRQASYLGVWGPGSLWGLNNVLLGGSSEVRRLPTTYCLFCGWNWLALRTLHAVDGLVVLLKDRRGCSLDNLSSRSIDLC